MGKEQAMQGTAASEERDLLEEASRGHSSAMCRRKSCERQLGQSERRPRGLGQGGHSRGRGREAGSEGS